jgi:hypothetical protein
MVTWATVQYAIHAIAFLSLMLEDQKLALAAI